MDLAILTPEQLRQHLKSLRRARGLTQAQLGKLLGVGQVGIANIEQDAGAVSMEQFMRLLAALDGRLVVRAEVPAQVSEPRRPRKAAPAEAKESLTPPR